MGAYGLVVWMGARRRLSFQTRSSVAGWAAGDQGETPGTAAGHEVGDARYLPGVPGCRAGSPFWMVGEVAVARAAVADGGFAGARRGKFCVDHLGDESEQLRFAHHPRYAGTKRRDEWSIPAGSAPDVSWGGGDGILLCAGAGLVGGLVGIRSPGPAAGFAIAR